MSSKVVFHYDDDGYYDGEVVVQEDPMQPGSWLMPANVVELAPELKDGFFYRWGGESWISEKKPMSAADFEGVVVSHKSQTPRNRELREIIQRVCDGSETHRVKRVGADNDWTVEPIPEKTVEEIAAEVRAKRDGLIAQTDYLVTPDYPIDAESLAAVTEYRRALRDVPQQDGFPTDVVWPELPAVMKEL